MYSDIVESLSGILFRPLEILPIDPFVASLVIPLLAAVIWAVIYRVVHAKYSREKPVWALVALWCVTGALVIISLPNLVHMLTCPMCLIITIPSFVGQVAIMIFGSGWLKTDDASEQSELTEWSPSS